MGRQAEASGPTQFQSNNRCLSCFAEGNGGGCGRGGGWQDGWGDVEGPERRMLGPCR